VKLVLIDPYAKTVSDVQLPEVDFEVLYKLLECDLIQQVSIMKNLVMLCDDEGLFKPVEKQRFFTIEGFAQPICGKAVLVGTDGQGEYMDSRFDHQTVEQVVRWCDTTSEQVLKAFPTQVIALN